jgi:hypothetical protein
MVSTNTKFCMLPSQNSTQNFEILDSTNLTILFKDFQLVDNQEHSTLYIIIQKTHG